MSPVVPPVALLAGGLATRLRPITERIPKAMVEVAGRPFIDHQLALFACHGIARVVLCLGFLGEQVAAHVGDGARYGLTVIYSHDGDHLIGTGGALRRAVPLLDETFWVIYGDSYLDFDYRAASAHFARHDALGMMTVLRNDNRWDRSNVVFKNGDLLWYDKRERTRDMAYIDYGASLLRREALARIPEGQPYDVADLYRTLIGEGRMLGHEVTQRFYEIGSHEGLAETRAFLDGSAQ